MNLDLYFFTALNILFLIFFFRNAKPVSKFFGLYKKNNITPLVGGIGIWVFFLTLLYIFTYFIMI